MRILLIDDEAPARSAIRGILREYPDFTLTQESETLEEAENHLQAGGYDVALLDVQLRGGTGFDLVPFVRPEARIVFVTGYEQFAIRAFEVNALDYLVKPVRPARLVEALRRLPQPNSTPQASPPTAHLRPEDLIYLKTGTGTTRFVPLADVVAIEAEDNYSTVFLANAPRMFVRRTMTAWEKMLPPTHFARVHRGTIINVTRYRGSDRETAQTTWLHLDGAAEPIKASFRYLPELRSRLQPIGRQL